MILNLYKPPGWTSFDVVKKIRGITREKKVGHAGTLDPFAEGVLLIGTGKDTKVLSEISNQSKSYRATLTLGISTNTMDLTGIEEKSLPIPELSTNKILATLNSFLGEQNQVPPMYSAKKVNGERLYKLARKNIEVEREPVPININSISLESIELPDITFSVECSKGTYIRVLGADIAEKLGTVGHLTYLQRTGIGDHNVKDSQSLESFEKSWKSAVA
jgi:tRNA pseudouridine55 synthase